MPQIDPKVTFWISIIIAICGFGSEASVWANAIPAADIPIVAQWNSIINGVGNVILPILLGQHITTQGRIAAAAASPGVKSIETTTSAIADAAPSDKVQVQAAPKP